MGVFDGQVGASGDDADEYKLDNSVTINGATVDLRNHVTYGHYIGVRFQNVTVPNGATITVAYCEICCQTGAPSADLGTVSIDLEDHDDAPVFVAAASNITNRTLTGNPGLWTPAALVLDTWYGSAISLVAAVQAVVNRGGWASGQSMAVIWKPPVDEARAARYFYAQDGTPAKAGKLHIEWLGNGNGGGVTLAHGYLPPVVPIQAD